MLMSTARMRIHMSPPWITGTSLFVTAVYNIRPMPGILKMTSMTTDPPSRPANQKENRVITGSMLLRTPCLSRVARKLSPRLRAAVMKGAASTSFIAALVTCAKYPRGRSESAMAGMTI